MKQTVPTSAFATLRSSLDPVAVMVSEAEQDRDGTASLLVHRAKSEVLETIADLLALGLSTDRVSQLASRELLDAMLDERRGIESITIADRLVALRCVARRIERAGLRRYGSRWRDKARPSDFRLV